MNYKLFLIICLFAVLPNVCSAAGCSSQGCDKPVHLACPDCAAPLCLNHTEDVNFHCCDASRNGQEAYEHLLKTKAPDEMSTMHLIDALKRLNVDHQNEHGATATKAVLRERLVAARLRAQPPPDPNDLPPLDLPPLDDLQLGDNGSDSSSSSQDPEAEYVWGPFTGFDEVFEFTAEPGLNEPFKTQIENSEKSPLDYFMLKNCLIGYLIK